MEPIEVNNQQQIGYFNPEFTLGGQQLDETTQKMKIVGNGDKVLLVENDSIVSAVNVNSSTQEGEE